jgi:hypothetical protein
MGKSFIMEMFIKDQVMKGAKLNFARIVPTKALINEVRKDTIDGLDRLLEEMNYSVVTAASDYSLEEDHNFILVMSSYKKYKPCKKGSNRPPLPRASFGTSLLYFKPFHVHLLL